MKIAASKTAEIYPVNGYLSKTINIFFTFDAPKEGVWGHTLQATDFKLIREAGFTAVRLLIQWVTRMNTEPPFTIDPQFLARIDWLLEKLKKTTWPLYLTTIQMTNLRKSLPFSANTF